MFSSIELAHVYNLNKVGLKNFERLVEEHWMDCFGKSSLKGHLFCGGVGAPNEIVGNAKLKEAYEIGRAV